MPTLYLKPKVKKFIQLLPPKHRRQVKDSILALGNNPNPHDAKPLSGYKPYLRVDIGEYRIIYRYDKSRDSVTISLVGKRNDGEVYRIMKRSLK